jgi:hypothetical protein
VTSLNQKLAIPVSDESCQAGTKDDGDRELRSDEEPDGLRALDQRKMSEQSLGKWHARVVVVDPQLRAEREDLVSASISATGVPQTASRDGRNRSNRTTTLTGSRCLNGTSGGGRHHRWHHRWHYRGPRVRSGWILRQQ